MTSSAHANMAMMNIVESAEAEAEGMVMGASKMMAMFKLWDVFAVKGGPRIRQVLGRKNERPTNCDMVTFQYLQLSTAL